ncbi:MAG: hypothetical protein V1775_03675 [Bacteroidota bacterium]
MGNIFTFREITEKAELEKAFRMRYKVYSKCRMQSFLKKNDYSIDIDHYDVHSRHYSLDCNDTNIGYLRVVLPKNEISQDSVLELAAKYELFDDYQSYLTSDVAPYPFLKYKGVPSGYWNFYKNLILRNEKLAEASRLVLDPEYRTIRSSKFLIECAIVLYFLICDGIKHALISCFADHAAFYHHYGFEEIEKCNGYKLPGIDKAPSFLTLSLSSIPVRNKSRFQNMANEFRTTGKIAMEI